MGVHYFEVYRSPNIGLFVRASEGIVLVPQGMADTKSNRLAQLLDVKPVPASVAGTRLLGPLSLANSHGIMLSKMAEEDEIAALRRETGLPVAPLPYRYTSVGNLIAANDYGALASPLLSGNVLQSIQDILDVPVEATSIASYHQIGAVVVATNSGALIHPSASEEEVTLAKNVLKVNVELGTVNGGVPIVASGLVANSRNAVVGNLTSGPELAIVARALRL